MILPTSRRQNSFYSTNRLHKYFCYFQIDNLKQVQHSPLWFLQPGMWCHTAQVWRPGTSCLQRDQLCSRILRCHRSLQRRDLVETLWLVGTWELLHMSGGSWGELGTQSWDWCYVSLWSLSVTGGHHSPAHPHNESTPLHHVRSIFINIYFIHLLIAKSK